MNRVTIRNIGHLLRVDQSAPKAYYHQTESSVLSTPSKYKSSTQWSLWAVAGSFVAAAMLIVGCVSSSKQFSYNQRWQGRNAAKSGSATQRSSTGYGTSGSQGYPSSYTAPPNQVPVLSDSGGEFDRPATSGGSSSNWEDQKVRIAALELARSIPSTSKVKICYDAKHDEWWVTLYDRQGAMFDLKQFVWVRDSEKFEPFLVRQQISESKLEEHVKREEKGRACEAFDPPNSTM